MCQILNLDVKELLNKTENYGLFCANEQDERPLSHKSDNFIQWPLFSDPTHLL